MVMSTKRAFLGDYAGPEVDATALDSHALHRAIRAERMPYCQEFF